VAAYEEEIEWLFRDEYDHHSIVLREADQPGCDYFTFKVAGYSDDHLGYGRASGTRSSRKATPLASRS
jgi:hypothetical protein